MNLHDVYKGLVDRRRIEFNIDTTEKQLLMDISSTLLRIEKVFNPGSEDNSPKVQGIEPVSIPNDSGTPVSTPEIALSSIPSDMAEQNPQATPQEALQPDVTVPITEQVIPQVEEVATPTIEETPTPSTPQPSEDIPPTVEQPVEVVNPQVENTVDTTTPQVEEQVNPQVEEQSTSPGVETTTETPSVAENTPVDDANVEFAQEIAPKKTRKSSKK